MQLWWLFVFWRVFSRVNINEREGAGRWTAGQDHHGPKADVLGAGESSQKVMMPVLLSGS